MQRIKRRILLLEKQRANLSNAKPAKRIRFENRLRHSLEYLEWLVEQEPPAEKKPEGERA
jgi:hypothetical protein